MSLEAPPQKFEHALAELDRVLRDLEDGTTTLEDALARYERGVALVKQCTSNSATPSSASANSRAFPKTASRNSSRTNTPRRSRKRSPSRVGEILRRPMGPIEA